MSQRPIHATPTGSIGGNQPLMKNAKLPCPDNSLRTLANAQLVINLLHVPFYRTLVQNQPVSYLPIAEAAAAHRENVDPPHRTVRHSVVQDAGVSVRLKLGGTRH